MSDIKKFLDQAGVSVLWSRVADELAKQDQSINEVKATADNTAADVIIMKGQIDALEKGTYDDSQLRALIGTNATNIQANADAIAILNSGAEVEGSVANIATSITAAKVAEIIAGADADFDTLKEIADWILNDTTGAAALINDVADLKALVGDERVPEQIQAAIAALEIKVADTYVEKKYAIEAVPVGTLVDYRGKEIRVMCPANTGWTHQESGTNADTNTHYFAFKAYAPVNAVSFKEDLKKQIEDTTMYYFENNDFAGIDANGRKYSIVWLAAAKYDTATQTWNYYGANSKVEKFIGFDYSVEWYDANGVKIDADTIRINLSNESCHTDLTPFYVTQAELRAKEYANGIMPVALTTEEIDAAIAAAKA